MLVRGLPFHDACNSWWRFVSGHVSRIPFASLPRCEHPSEHWPRGGLWATRLVWLIPFPILVSLFPLNTLTWVEWRLSTVLGSSSPPGWGCHQRLEVVVHEGMDPPWLEVGLVVQELFPVLRWEEFDSYEPHFQEVEPRTPCNCSVVFRVWQSVPRLVVQPEWCTHQS